MVKKIKNQDKTKIIFFVVILVAITLLWLPTLRNPINADALVYSLLSEDLIESGTYSILGEPHPTWPPGHPLSAIPFVGLLGKNLGMKVATLFWAFILLISSFVLFKNKKDRLVPYLIVILLLLNPFVIYLSMHGSSDIVFSVFFILSLLLFKLAQKDKHFYYLTGITIAMTCLIRYPGIMLFPIFFMYLLLTDRKKIFKKEYIIMNLIALSIFSLWFIRNYIVFGNPLYTKYMYYRQYYLATISNLSPLNSLLFYLNPVHNISPILFIFMLYGIMTTYKKNKLFVLSIFIFPLFYIAWSVNPRVRHMLALFPIFLYFSVIGFKRLLVRYRRFKVLIITLFLVGILMNIGMFFVYTYGETNYVIDKYSDIIPKDLDLSSEDIYSISSCIRYINKNLSDSSYIVAHELEKATWEGAGIFREDLILISEKETPICSNTDCYYLEKENCSKEYLFKTDNAPQYCVRRYILNESANKFTV